MLAAIAYGAGTVPGSDSRRFMGPQALESSSIEDGRLRILSVVVVVVS